LPQKVTSVLDKTFMNSFNGNTNR